jgi:cephalosporin-C deacetylase-like acetyl esterase
MDPYGYDNNKLVARSVLRKETPKLIHNTIYIESALDTGYSENGVIKAEYYWPKVNNRTPLVILVHGMGDHSVIPCKLLARSLLKKGVACSIPYLTIHSKRIPKVMQDHMPYLTPEEWFQSYRISVTDIRQLIDWSSYRAEIDSQQVTVLGISFGGFVSMIAMGIDQRIKAGVFIVTSGNSSKISWLSRTGQYRKRYPRTESEYLEIQRSYDKYLEDISIKGFGNVVPGNKSFYTDPLTFASDLRRRPILMINALWDKYIPRETVIELWHALGEPTIKWIPSGHTSIWLWYSAIRKSIMSLFNLHTGISTKSGLEDDRHAN